MRYRDQKAITLHGSLYDWPVRMQLPLEVSSLLGSSRSFFDNSSEMAAEDSKKYWSQNKATEYERAGEGESTIRQRGSALAVA